MMGPEEVITPLPAPWLGLKGDFLFGEASPRVTIVLFDGRSSFLSGFLFETLLTVLGADEVPSSVLYPLCQFRLLLFTGYSRAYSLLSIIHFYKNDRYASGKADGKNETDGFGEKFTYCDGSISLIFELLASV